MKGATSPVTDFRKVHISDKLEMSTICLSSKFGYCKFGNNCDKTHFKDKCENEQCSGHACFKRHPKECFFFKNFGRCKFGSYCSYNHKTTKEQKLMIEIEMMKSELNTVKQNFKSELTDLRKEVSESKKASEILFGCDYCDKKYTTEKKLRQHKTKKHEQEMLDETESEDDCCMEKFASLKEEVVNLNTKVKELTEKVETFENEKVEAVAEKARIEKEKIDLEEQEAREREKEFAKYMEEKEGKEERKQEALKADTKELFTGIIEDNTLDKIIRENSGLHCDMCDYGPAKSKRGLLLHKVKKHSGHDYEPQIRNVLSKVLDKNLQVK